MPEKDKEVIEAPEHWLYFRRNWFRGTAADPNEGEYPGLKAGFGLPVFYTPLTNRTDHWSSFQGSRCEVLEMDYIRCASRVGLRNVQRGRECLMEFEDLHECLSNKKSKYRRYLMHVERKKQNKDFGENPPKFTTHRPKNPGHACHMV